MDQFSQVRLLILLVTLSCKLDLLVAEVDGLHNDIRRFNDESPEDPPVRHGQVAGSGPGLDTCSAGISSAAGNRPEAASLPMKRCLV